MERGTGRMERDARIRLYRLDWDGDSRYVIEQDGEWRALEGDVFGRFEAGPVVDVAGRRRLAPVLPSKIAAIGWNYLDHATETGQTVPAEPLVFMKPSTAVIGPREAIRVPPWAGRVDHEAELGVVIGRTAYRVAEHDAHRYILGVTCVNDVTARDLQRRDGQFTRAKSFDTFAPVGPCVAVGLDWSAVDIEARVNGQRRQASNTRAMAFSVFRLVAHVTAFMTMLPGDLIATGTPSGIGPIVPGDVVTIAVSGIGELSNPVVEG